MCTCAGLGPSLACGYPDTPSEKGQAPARMSLAGGPLTFLQHPHFEAFHEAAGLAGLPPPLGDLTLVGGRAAVLDVPCKQTDSVARCPAGPPPTGQRLDRD